MPCSLRRRKCLVVCTAVCLSIFVSFAVAQNDFDADFSGDETHVDRAATVTAAIPTPTPTVDTYAVPAPSALPDSKTFAKTPNVQCDSVVANASMQIYANNRPLFDKCVIEGKYQIFPYSGTLPTKQQIDSMVRAESCRSVFTACVLGNLPQCDIGGLALKSATETLLKIAVDVLDGKEVPDSAKFYELLLWRRDVNLAQAKGLAYDQDSQLYGEYSHNLWKALTNTNVKVSHDLTISFDGSGSSSSGVEAGVFLNVTSGSDVTDVVGKVKAPELINGGSFANNATKTSGASPKSTLCTSVALSMAAIVWTTPWC